MKLHGAPPISCFIALDVTFPAGHTPPQRNARQLEIGKWGQWQKMRRLDRGGSRLLLLTLTSVLAGCNGEDVDHIARIGSKIADRAQCLPIGGEAKWKRGWEVVCNGWDETTLEARVGMRLRWDKSLSDTKIQVTSADGIVELRGTVNDANQRQRAIELAESTAGVEQVIDALQEPPAEP